MIRRERASVAPPKRFLSRARKALGELRSFYELDRSVRSQRRAPEDPSLLADSSLRAALLKLFDGKCAYCESPLAKVEFDVDRFRPPRDAMDQSNRVDDPDLYWWLAYDWENLYAACPACASAKATRFPVRRKRAAPEARGPELDDEQRMLLDPCADEPEDELRFSADGTVAGVTERGAVSIEVFALNRRELVRARRSAAEKLLALLVTVPADRIEAQRATLAPAAAPYAAMHGQLLEQHVGKQRLPLRAVSRARAERGSVWLERVHVENFRVIRRLSIEFPEHQASTEREPWLMLLGVNGVGKSSLLQTIALPFMPAGNRKRYIPDASQLVNRNTKAREGHVQLDFSDGTRTVLRFRRGEPRFRVEGRPPPMNVYAFGSTRLPPAPGQRSDDRPRLVRLNNLFDPRYPLSVAEAWIADPKRVNGRTFTFLARALHQLLEMDEDERVVRTRGVLGIRRAGLTLPVSEYSDGYRSIVAFATDLMLNLSDRWDSIGSAEGLVLVDELEVHLHPSWRMTVVDRLRDVFPRLRLVITTHDPLCLRGAAEGEVHVLRRDEETREVLIVQRDIPPGLTADELLTGSWFGMATTLDDGTIKLMREHGDLLLKRDTRAVRRRRETVEEELRERRGTFAETDDERLVRSVVAQLRAEKPPLTEDQLAAARQAVVERARATQGKGRAAP
jgi:uncharacterized protein (TIGR02646 family)